MDKDKNLNLNGNSKKEIDSSMKNNLNNESPIINNSGSNKYILNRNGIKNMGRNKNIDNSLGLLNFNPQSKFKKIKATRFFIRRKEIQTQIQNKQLSLQIKPK